MNSKVKITQQSKTKTEGLKPTIGGPAKPVYTGPGPVDCLLLDPRPFASSERHNYIWEDTEV
jgi:hypothetical protein